MFPAKVSKVETTATKISMLNFLWYLDKYFPTQILPCTIKVFQFNDLNIGQKPFFHVTWNIFMLQYSIEVFLSQVFSNSTQYSHSTRMCTVNAQIWYCVVKLFRSIWWLSTRSFTPRLHECIHNYYLSIMYLDRRIYFSITCSFGGLNRL